MVHQQITRDEYINHDCHLSPDNGCNVCEAWWTEARHRNTELNLEVELLNKLNKDYAI